jgi:hypothetical protein
MKVAYERWAPTGDTAVVVEQANAICEAYAAQGYDLTLRQCYYQFVARGLIENTERSYKRLGTILNRARMAGMLDWSHIVDRTRNLESLTHWDDPAEILRAAARGFHVDTWSTQPTRVEVWVEKEALAGVVERAAEAWVCAYFSCRGYVSQSEQWAAAQRLRQYLVAGQRVVVVHLGDHDPSGLDMTRDIRDRLTTFITRDHAADLGYDLDEDPEDVWEVWEDFEHRNNEWMERHPPDDDWWPHDLVFHVERIALNRDQVDRYQPPPNPAKLSDSRASTYVAEHGFQSWELDALDPATLDDLIQRTIIGYVDETLLEERRTEQEAHRSHLTTVATRWRDVVEAVAGE